VPNKEKKDADLPFRGTEPTLFLQVPRIDFPAPKFRDRFAKDRAPADPPIKKNESRGQ